MNYGRIAESLGLRNEFGEMVVRTAFIRARNDFEKGEEDALEVIFGNGFMPSDSVIEIAMTERLGRSISARVTRAMAESALGKINAKLATT